MNDLKVFSNEEFGEIRTVEVEGKPMFCLTDICRALELTQPSKVKERLSEKGVNIIPTLTAGGKQNLLYVDESNLYKTIFQSRKESAERFTDWVTSEVLPTLRKTGSYEMPKKKKSNCLPLSSVNMMVKNVVSAFEKAKVEPVFVAAEVKRLYTDLGYEVKAPLVTDKETMPKLYDCTEIAKELGIMSKSGLPHNQAVGDIIRKLDITSQEVQTTAFSRNGHDDVTVQYLPSVVNKVRGWLEENNYPFKIPYVDSKGNPKTRTVTYKETHERIKKDNNHNIGSG